MHAAAQVVEALRYKPEVAGLIPDEVIGIFRRLNPSGRIQPLTRPGCRADNDTTFICRLSENSGSSISWDLRGLSRAVKGLICLHLCHAHDDGYVRSERVGGSTFVCNVSIFIEGLNMNVCVFTMKDGSVSYCLD